LDFFRGRYDAEAGERAKHDGMQPWFGTPAERTLRMERALLDLCPGLPARKSCFSDSQELRELSLCQLKGFAVLADLRWSQHAEFLADRIGNPPIDVIVEQDVITFLTAQNLQIRNRDRVLAPIVFEFGRVFDYGWSDGTGTALAAFPQSWFVSIGHMITSGGVR